MTDKAKADQEMKEENLEQAAAPAEEAAAPNNQEADELKAAIEAGDFDINDFLTQYKEAISAKEEAEARAFIPFPRYEIRFAHHPDPLDFLPIYPACQHRRPQRKPSFAAPIPVRQR